MRALIFAVALLCAAPAVAQVSPDFPNACNLCGCCRVWVAPDGTETWITPKGVVYVKPHFPRQFHPHPIG